MLTYVLGLLQTVKRIEIIFYAGKTGENRIPRALMTNLMILILDEVTSYLDTNYLHLQQQNISRFLPTLVEIDNTFSKLTVS